MAKTVRVDERLHATLREIALEEKRSIGQVIEDAIRQYRRERFWEGVEEDLARLRADRRGVPRRHRPGEDLARLRADPVAWKDYQDEIALWDTLSGDGLAGEELYYTAEEEAEFRSSDL